MAREKWEFYLNMAPFGLHDSQSRFRLFEDRFETIPTTLLLR